MNKLVMKIDAILNPTIEVIEPNKLYTTSSSMIRQNLIEDIKRKSSEKEFENKNYSLLLAKAVDKYPLFNDIINYIHSNTKYNETFKEKNAVSINQLIVVLYYSLNAAQEQLNTHIDYLNSLNDYISNNSFSNLYVSPNRRKTYKVINLSQINKHTVDDFTNKNSILNIDSNSIISVGRDISKTLINIDYIQKVNIRVDRYNYYWLTDEKFSWSMNNEDDELNDTFTISSSRTTPFEKKRYKYASDESYYLALIKELYIIIDNINLRDYTLEVYLEQDFFKLVNDGLFNEEKTPLFLELLNEFNSMIKQNNIILNYMLEEDIFDDDYGRMPC